MNVSGEIKNLIPHVYQLLPVMQNFCSSDADGILKELRIGMKSGKLKKPLPAEKTRQMNFFESVFAASIIPCPENKRIIIENIHEGSVFERHLSIGDAIKSIDGDIITPDNIIRVLRRIITQKSFKIVANENSYEYEMSSKEELRITKLSDIVDQREKLFQLASDPLELIFSLNLIVKNEISSEDSDDFTTVFSFPPMENNFIHKLKGSFLTITSILNGSFGTLPIITTIKVHKTSFYVTYTIRNSEKQFIFLGFNSHYTKAIDARLHTENIIKFLDFYFPNFLEISDFQQISNICEMIKIQLLKNSSEIVNFEQLFQCTTYVPLPKEIVLRINDSLSELEAMDYRNWNEDLMELFGKFNVIGSCLFYKNFLLCSHLGTSEMENVEMFIRNHCIKLLYENCVIREIAMWQRVFPKDFQSFNKENDSTKNKVFMLMAAHGNLLLAVLLEENNFNLKTEIESQSSNYLIYFMEEMDDILDHLKTIGIENLSRIWVSSAKRPQTNNFLEKKESKSAQNAETQSHLKTLREEDENEDFESQGDSQKSSSGFDMTDFSDALYKDFTDIVPQTLTYSPSNKNVLYHFTQLDFTEGTLITSINDYNKNGKNEILVDIFRRSCDKIHKMLQNTIKFNELLSKEGSKLSHKSSLISIKEQAIKVHYKSATGDSADFWVVGRLFGAKELFLCYDVDVPQSMVEIGFRLTLNTFG